MNNLPGSELKVLVLRRRKACLSSCHSALIGNSLLCVASTQISEKADRGCNQHFHGTHHNHQPHGIGAPPKGEGIIEVERHDLSKCGFVSSKSKQETPGHLCAMLEEAFCPICFARESQIRIYKLWVETQ